MKYQWAGEVDKTAFERSRLIGLATERLITERLTAGELANIDVLIGYCPIIMAPEHAKRYPARTKVSHKRRALDCAPQLDHERFTTKSVEAAAEEYAKGIIESLPLLSRLRLTDSEIGQIEEFFARVSADLHTQLHGIP